MLIAAIVIGFKVEESLPGLFLALGLALLVTAASLWAIVRRNSTPVAVQQLRRGVTIGLATGVFILGGAMYGAVLQFLIPSTDPFPTDAAVTLEARVTSVTAIASGQRLVLQVGRIQSVAKPGTKRVSFAAEWIQWNHPDEVKVGDTLRLSGELQVPPLTSAKGKLIRQELAQMGISYQFEGHLLQRQPASGWQQQTMDMISRAITVLHVDPADSSLLESIVFGHQNRPIPSQVHSDFLRSGLLHVLAASGANVFFIEWFVSVVLFPLKWLCRYLHLPQSPLQFFSVVLLWVFCALCSFQSSIVRATLMATYRSWGQMLGRQVTVVNGLLIAALLMTIVQPNTLFGPSAALSFTATAAVQKAIHTPARQLHQGSVKFGIKQAVWLGRKVFAMAKVSVIVELFILPLELLWFQQLTPLSVMANIVAEPLIAVLLPVTAALFVVASLHLLLPWTIPLSLLKLFCALDVTFLHGLLAVTQWLGALPQSLYRTHAISIVDVLSYYLALIGLPTLVKRGKQ